MTNKHNDLITDMFPSLPESHSLALRCVTTSSYTLGDRNGFEFKLATVQWQGLQISMANFGSLAPSLRGGPGTLRVARPGVNFLQLLRSTRLVASTEIQKSTK